MGVQIFSLCDPTVHGFSSCPAAGQTFGITDVPKNFAQATEQEDLCFKLVFLAAWYGSVPFGRKMIPIRSESCQALRFVGMISLLAVLLLVVQGLMQINWKHLEASFGHLPPSALKVFMSLESSQKMPECGELIFFPA